MKNILLLKIKFLLIGILFTQILNSQTGTCLNFDGINDNVRVPLVNFSAGNMMTVEAWIKPKNVTSNMYYEISRQENSPAPDWLLSFQNNGTILSFGLKTTMGYTELDIPITASYYTDGNWHHVAAVYNGSMKYVYVDGVQIGSEPRSGNVTFTGFDHRIGSQVGISEYFNGEIDEVRYWNVARTLCEINTFRYVEIPTTAPGLVGNYHFNQGIAAGNNVGVTTLIDAAGAVGTGTLINFALTTGTVSNWVGLSPSLARMTGPSLICDGSSATYSINPIPGATGYTWSLPGGWAGSSTTNTIFATSGASSGTITVIPTTSCASTSPIVLSVTVTPSPTVNVASSNSSVCAGTSVTLSATGATSYTYNPGNIVGNPVVVNPTVTTTYTVTGSNGACTSSASITQNVSASLLVNVASSNSLICAGSAVTLSATGATSYTYNPGNIVGNPVVVNPTVTTIYTVTGSNGSCTGTTSITQNVSTSLAVNVASSTSLICAGGSATLTGSGATSYTWNPGSLLGSPVVVSPTATTIYTIIGSNGTCTGTTSITQNVSGVNVASSNSSICAGTSVTLTASGATSYTWNPGSLFGSQVVVSPTTSTIYTITGTNGSCTDITSITQNVSASPAVSIASSSSVICVGSTVTLTATGAASYTFNPGNIVGNPVTFSPSVSTIYTVTGSNGTCDGFASIIQGVSACTGVESLTLSNSEFQVRPNPNNGQFIIKTDWAEVFDISIYNGIGQLVEFIPQNKFSASVNLSEHSKGIYTILLNSNGNCKNLKVIVE